MRWQVGRRSQNVEDRRGAGVPTGGMRRGGIGGLALVGLLLLGLFLGFDRGLLSGFAPSGTPSGAPAPQIRGDRPATAPMPSADQSDLREFVSVVLADTEDVWSEIFQRNNLQYREPKLVLFSGAVRSACGIAEAAMGPFYCPIDEKVYLDFTFFEDMRRRFAAPGDFAQAYVIAHEVGHHVQNLLGIAPRVQALREQLGPAEGNRLIQMMELQADCLAGIWASHAQRARQILESGDIEEALNAASAIGDDRMQRRTQGYVVPDAFTHGSSQQRVRWFKRGLTSGDLASCDTFNAPSL
jgi:predicted metalloprotease